MFFRKYRKRNKVTSDVEKSFFFKNFSDVEIKKYFTGKLGHMSHLPHLNYFLYFLKKTRIPVPITAIITIETNAMVVGKCSWERVKSTTKSIGIKVDLMLSNILLNHNIITFRMSFSLVVSNQNFLKKNLSKFLQILILVG